MATTTAVSAPSSSALAPRATLWRCWFGATLFAAIVPLVTLSHMLRPLVAVGLFSEQASNDLTIIAGSKIFGLFLLANPQVKIVRRSMVWPYSTRPALLLMNHTSFLDLFLFTSLLPARTVLGQHVRCMVSHHLFKIPGFGRTMGEHSGSFPVHFSTKSAIVVNKSEDADGFGTDKTKQQLVQERVAAHVVGGGSVALCPEGTVNKAPPALQLFRKGSFALAVEHKMPIFGCVMAGNYECWPKVAAIGGWPATIVVENAYLMTPEEGQTAEQVAALCQKAMQAKLDELLLLRNTQPAHFDGARARF